MRSFLCVASDTARAAADEVDAARARGAELGPLAGVPVAVKDMFCTRDLPTTAASRILEGWRPPYDKNSIKAIEKSIQASDLGITPSNDGVVIRLAFPQLTAERRKEMVKIVKHRAEEARVAVRNVRRSARHDLEAFQKEGELSEDDLDRAEKELEKLTHEFVAEIDTLAAHKEQEMLEV